MLTPDTGPGEKTFEQCAGFLKIPGSDTNWTTAGAPENYALAAELLSIIKAGADPSHEQRAALKENIPSATPPWTTSSRSWKKPNRDPRRTCLPHSAERRAFLRRSQGGMKVTGKVKNVWTSALLSISV
jgi:uncharacterized protein